MKILNSIGALFLILSLYLSCQSNQKSIQGTWVKKYSLYREGDTLYLGNKGILKFSANKLIHEPCVFESLSRDEYSEAFYTIKNNQIFVKYSPEQTDTILIKMSTDQSLVLKINNQEIHYEKLVHFEGAKYKSELEKRLTNKTFKFPLNASIMT